VGDAVLEQVFGYAWHAAKAVHVVGHPRGGGRRGGHYGGGEPNAEWSRHLESSGEKGIPGSLHEALGELVVPNTGFGPIEVNLGLA
jgi:hypothetical protein